MHAAVEGAACVFLADLAVELMTKSDFQGISVRERASEMRGRAREGGREKGRERELDTHTHARAHARTHTHTHTHTNTQASQTATL